MKMEIDSESVVMADRHFGKRSSVGLSAGNRGVVANFGKDMNLPHECLLRLPCQIVFRDLNQYTIRFSPCQIWKTRY